MKKLFYSTLIPLLASVFFLASCSSDDNEDITPTTDSTGTAPTYDVELVMAEGDADKSVPVTVDASKGTISARIAFTSTNESMKRVYFTQNIGGAGETDYTIDASADKKKDGSIDVTSDRSNELEYKIDLPVPSGITSGTVEYKVWATSGRGDYRDPSKRKVVGVGTIVLEYGGTNADAEVKSYTETLLAAPLADFTSKTFVSLKNGQTYAGADGIEFAAFWDFGYYNSTSENASLASANAYETAFTNSAGNTVYDVDVLTGTPTDELNKCYFALSTKTASEFDAIKTSGDLNSISQSSTQEVNNLKKDDVVEFVDNYGKKGLIKVLEVKGTFNSGDYIKIAIKVQP